MRTLTLSVMAAALFACARESSPEPDLRRSAESPPHARHMNEASAAEAPKVSHYPPGRWRLAPPEELFQVLIPLSHVLIRHEGVQEGIVSFHLPMWTPSSPPPARTLEQAHALAEELAGRLRRNPKDFATVARDVSEDIATRSLGGTLGSLTAAELMQVPEVLDALSAIDPGEVSQVVETQYGFHIFQKKPPPEEQQVSGARIVIAYDQAPWLGAFLARRPLPPRAREEAMRLAQSIYERARSGESFDKLAREYSDHREALRGGDFGAWSTHESTPFPREIDLLAGLEVGEVHPPIDSPFGVEVLQRVVNRPRKAFGMSTVQQSFDPRASKEDPTSRNWVLKNVQALAGEIGKDTAKFTELQKQYCCAKDQQWIEGRGEAEAEAILLRLRPGEIASEPIEMAAAFGVIKRLEPRPRGVQEFSFDLPAPDKPDIRYWVSTGTLSTSFQGFAAETAAALALEPSIANQLAVLLGALVSMPDAPQQERPAQFERLQNDVLALLGPARFQRFLQLLEEHVERELLEDQSSPRQRVLSGAPVPVR